MPTAAIYARVSTEEQARTGYSIDDQIGACRQKLFSLGMTDILEYIDAGRSGEFLERPELARLRQDLGNNLLRAVIVYDPDRLSRNLVHMLLLADEIKSANAELIFITGSYDASPEGRLFFSMRGAIAEFEKEKIRERTLRGKRNKALAGKIVIPCPRFGYDLNHDKSNYVINENEAETVRWIYDQCIAGSGLHQIANRLNSRKIANKQGNPINYQYVYKILTSEIYFGTRYEFRYNWTKTGPNKYAVTRNPPEEWIHVTVPAIIPEETFLDAQKALQSNKKHSRRNRHRDYLLTGIIKCKRCGRGMVAIPASKRPYYVCHGKRNKSNPCPESAWLPAGVVEERVWGMIMEAAAKNTPLQPLGKLSVPDRSDEIARLQSVERQLRRRRSAIALQIAKGTIDASDAEEALSLLNKEIAETAAHIAAACSVQPKAGVTVFNQADLLGAQTLAEKRKILLDSGVIVQAFLPSRMIRYSRNFEVDLHI